MGNWIGRGSVQHADRSCTLLRAAVLDTSATTTRYVDPGLELDANGKSRIPYRPQGWNFWTWQGHKVHYLQAGDSGPPILLVHGFGASAYHWRYNIAELAKKHRVYAVDLLGFGWSEKALVDYNYDIWSDQLSAFIREVVGGEQVVIAGNSLGGYNSLATAALHPDLVRGVVLLNGAGRFEDVKTAVEAPVDAALSSPERAVKNTLEKQSGQQGPTEQKLSTGNGAGALARDDSSTASTASATSSKQNGNDQSMMQQLMNPVMTVAKRVAIFGSFMLTKQPARVRQVLNQVYIDPTNVDDTLVQSICRAADDPNAAEVFYRVITGSGNSINSLLARLDNKMPLLLLWGVKDPWIGPSSADRVQRLYPKADRVNVQAGHCPHDEKPDEVTRALMQWIDQLPDANKY